MTSQLPYGSNCRVGQRATERRLVGAAPPPRTEILAGRRGPRLRVVRATQPINLLLNQPAFRRRQAIANRLTSPAPKRANVPGSGTVTSRSMFPDTTANP